MKAKKIKYAQYLISHLILFLIQINYDWTIGVNDLLYLCMF
jgi:hypothetical protein